MYLCTFFKNKSSKEVSNFFLKKAIQKKKGGVYIFRLTCFTYVEDGGNPYILALLLLSGQN